jgi:hypothetical protein
MQRLLLTAERLEKFCFRSPYFLKKQSFSMTLNLMDRDKSDHQLVMFMYQCSSLSNCFHGMLKSNPTQRDPAMYTDVISNDVAEVILRYQSN